MCGRFSLYSNKKKLKEVFNIDWIQDLHLGYNIPPSTKITVVIEEDDKRILTTMRWGLIPSWSKDPKRFFINARSETVFEKPAFRSSIRKRRCLILANGFFEWKEEGESKQPYYIRLKDKSLFAIAGIWDHWNKDPKQPLTSCSILTKPANSSVEPVHERMPVILTDNQVGEWLEREEMNPYDIDEMLKQPLQHPMDVYRVTKKINSPSFNEKSCVEPLSSRNN